VEASPNLEPGLFDTLERYRFAGAKAVDSRGIPERNLERQIVARSPTPTKGNIAMAGRQMQNVDLSLGNLYLEARKLCDIFWAILSTREPADVFALREDVALPGLFKPAFSWRRAKDIAWHQGA